MVFNKDAPFHYKTHRGRLTWLECCFTCAFGQFWGPFLLCFPIDPDVDNEGRLIPRENMWVNKRIVIRGNPPEGMDHTPDQLKMSMDQRNPYYPAQMGHTPNYPFPALPVNPQNYPEQGYPPGHPQQWHPPGHAQQWLPGHPQPEYSPQQWPGYPQQGYPPGYPQNYSPYYPQQESVQPVQGYPPGLPSAPDIPTGVVVPEYGYSPH